MRTGTRLLGACLMVLCVAPLGTAEEKGELPDWLAGSFAAPPPAGAMVSEKQTLRWTAMLGDGRLRHLARLADAAFCPDGTWVAAADLGGQIKIWETATGREIRTLSGHPDDLAVSVSPDGRKIISGGRDWRVRVWDASTGKLLHTLKAHEYYPEAVAISGDGKHFVSAGVTGRVNVWDARDGRVVHTYLMGPQPYSFATSRNGRWIACGSRLGEIRITEAVTGKQRALLIGHPGTVSCVAVTDDGSRIVTGDWKGVVRIWDTATGRTVRSLRGHRKDWALDCVDVTPDGSRIVSGGHDRTVRIWDAASGKLLQTLAGHPWIVSAVAVSADGQRAFSGDWQSYCFLWDTQSGKPLLGTEPRTQPAWVLVPMKQGTRLVTNGPPGSLHVWDTKTRTVLHTLEGPEGYWQFACAAGSTSWLVSGSTLDGKLRIWDPSTWKLVRTLPTPQLGPRSKMRDRDEFGAIAISENGALIVSANEEGMLRLWDRSTGTHVRSTRAHGGHVACMAFRPGTDELASGGDGRDTRVCVWDEEGKQRLALSGHAEGVRAVAYSPDGKWLVLGGCDKAIRFWDAETGKPVRVLEGHTGMVEALQVTPDGKWLFSAAWDDTLRVWDMKTGNLRDSIQVGGGPTAIAIVGTRVWVSCRNSTVCGYEFSP